MAPGYPTGGDFNCSEPETVRNGDRHTLEIWAPDDLSPRYLARKSDGNVLYIVNNLKGSKMTLDYEQLK